MVLSRAQFITILRPEEVTATQPVAKRAIVNEKVSDIRAGQKPAYRGDLGSSECDDLNRRGLPTAVHTEDGKYVVTDGTHRALGYADERGAVPVRLNFGAEEKKWADFAKNTEGLLTPLRDVERVEDF